MPGRARFRLYSLLLAVACCSTAIAQTAAKLTVLPTDGRAVGLVRTTIAGRWFVLATDLTPVRTEAFRLTPEAGGGSIIYWEGAPGTSYTVLFAPDDATEDLAAAVVRLGGKSVTPDDPDPPGPTNADQVTIVTESTEPLPAEQLEILNGQEVRSAAQAAGLEFHTADKDVTGPSIARIQHAIDATKNQSIPRIVFSAQGQVVAHAPLPDTVAQTLALIRRYAKE